MRITCSSEIKERVAAGPVRFEVRAQLAALGDVVDDSTIHWGEDRQVVLLGRIELTAMVPDDAADAEDNHLRSDTEGRGDRAER